MFQIHVVLDDPKTWLDYLPVWITAGAALIAAGAAIVTVIVARRIAANQDALQKALAETQHELQKEQNALQAKIADAHQEFQRAQIEQQARLLKKDLFDRRFAIFTDALEFISFVLRRNGEFELPGPEYRQFRQTSEKAEMLFGDDVRSFLRELDKTASDFWVSALGQSKAIAEGDVAAIRKNTELMCAPSDSLLRRRVEVFRPYLTL